MKSTASKLRENRKPLRFTQIKNEPTPEQIRIYYILNFVDMVMTMHALKNDRIREGNPLLGEKPSNQDLILHKLILAPLIEQNFEREQMTFVNFALGYTVVSNTFVMTKYGAW